MELGIISWIEEENFRKAKELGLSFVELDVNDRLRSFIASGSGHQLQQGV